MSRKWAAPTPLSLFGSGVEAVLAAIKELGWNLPPVVVYAMFWGGLVAIAAAIVLGARWIYDHYARRHADPNVGIYLPPSYEKRERDGSVLRRAARHSLMALMVLAGSLLAWSVWPVIYPSQPSLRGQIHGILVGEFDFAGQRETVPLILVLATIKNPSEPTGIFNYALKIDMPDGVVDQPAFFRAPTPLIIPTPAGGTVTLEREAFLNERRYKRLDKGEAVSGFVAFRLGVSSEALRGLWGTVYQLSFEDATGRRHTAHYTSTTRSRTDVDKLFQELTGVTPPPR